MHASPQPSQPNLRTGLASGQVAPWVIKPGSIVLFSSPSGIAIAAGNGKVIEGRGLTRIGSRSAQIWEPVERETRALLLREGAAASDGETSMVDALDHVLARELGPTRGPAELAEALRRSPKFKLVSAP